jgi:hypothetical protein
MGILRKLKKALFGKPRRRYGPTLHVDLSDPREWITDGKLFKCKQCGTTTLSDTCYKACPSCGHGMEKHGRGTSNTS